MRRDEVRQLKEALNVLSSYSHALDLMAEALQNATDAIDTRREGAPRAPGRILITFNANERRFSVADTGIGMSREDIQLVLTPNVTLKAGPLARTRRGRSRGEKGVGLSFLALASNYLTIETSDGSAAQEVVVAGAHDWVRSEGKTKRPKGQHREGAAASRFGSKRYTVVTVGEIDPEEYDDDLFAYSREELIWLLRTRTAVGDTRYLFEDQFDPSAHASDIKVSLEYIAANGTRRKVVKVPYAYATPEELLPSAKRVVDFDELDGLEPAELVRKVRGAAVRYRQNWTTPSGHTVSMYAFIIDGDDMLVYKRDYDGRDKFFPAEWQGFFVATRAMPTGVPIPVNVIQPRAYLRRIFALVQDDDVVLDLGRKTLHGPTRKMFEGVITEAWKEDLSAVVPRIKSDVTAAEVDSAALAAIVARSRSARDVSAHIPYIKWPNSETAVLAIFHELVALEYAPLVNLRPLATGIFGHTDSLIYRAPVNGGMPLHVLFGLTGSDVIAGLEQDKTQRTADLAVIWDAGEDELARRGVELRAVADTTMVATHEMMLFGIGGLQALPTVVLRQVLEEQP